MNKNIDTLVKKFIEEIQKCKENGIKFTTLIKVLDHKLQEIPEELEQFNNLTNKLQSNEISLHKYGRYVGKRHLMYNTIAVIYEEKRLFERIGYDYVGNVW